MLQEINTFLTSVTYSPLSILFRDQLIYYHWFLFQAYLTANGHLDHLRFLHVDVYHSKKNRPLGAGVRSRGFLVHSRMQIQFGRCAEVQGHLKRAAEVPLSKALKPKRLTKGPAMSWQLIQRGSLPLPVCTPDRLQHTHDPAREIAPRKINK